MSNNTNYFDKAFEIYNQMSFSDKCKAVRSVRGFSSFVNYEGGSIRWNGYVVAKEAFALNESGGDSYVYLWKHIDGDIFYVGSGKKDRWIQKFRNDSFLKEIDKGDSVVYKVLAGVDRQTAFLYERYISYSLGKAGYYLCNSDNLFHADNQQTYEKWVKCNQKELSSERCRKVENIILSKILNDEDFKYSVHKSILGFRNEYGNDYFSKNFCKNKKTENLQSASAALS